MSETETATLRVGGRLPFAPQDVLESGAPDRVGEGGSERPSRIADGDDVFHRQGFRRRGDEDLEDVRAEFEATDGQPVVSTLRTARSNPEFIGRNHRR